jgi:hypothetical protein
MRSEAKFSSPTSDLSSLIHIFASIWLVIILATQLPKLSLQSFILFHQPQLHSFLRFYPYYFSWFIIDTLLPSFIIFN